MKYIITLSLFVSSIFCLAQQTIIDTIMHGGIERTFTLYVPAVYTSGTSAPLVFNFHGYTSNMTQQMIYGDFRSIADTAGFIIVHPMGTLDGGGNTYFNSGWGGSVDDVGFTAALIDSISADYNINQDRVFSTGMSNGGFMSYYLACELSDRIAAIASVTGTMNANQVNTCNVQHPMPVMEIHGTADPTVPYAGNTTMESTENTVDYWVGYNNADVTSIFTAVPDINVLDGCTAEHYIYENGDNGVEVELYKIIDGAHTWPGAFSWGTTVNQDIDASYKIWEFFAKYDINGRIQSGGGTRVELINIQLVETNVYPNPASNFIKIAWNNSETAAVKVINMLGVVVEDISVKGKESITISTVELTEGVYFVEVGSVTTKVLVIKN